jgi:hypothetical protein
MHPLPVSQNSLMASPPRHPFWKIIFKDMASVWAAEKDKAAFIEANKILSIAGPRILTKAVALNPNMVQVRDSLGNVLWV